MFKYTKRLLSDIRFWCQEYKLRSKENAEWEQIELEAEGGWRHHMAGFSYYQTIKHKRAERKCLHKNAKATIF